MDTLRLTVIGNPKGYYFGTPPTDEDCSHTNKEALLGGSMLRSTFYPVLLPSSIFLCSLFFTNFYLFHLSLLRSAVGKTHDLRSDLWWTIPLHIFIDRLGIPLGSQPIKLALARHSGVQVPVISHHGVMWFLDQSQSSLRNFRQKAGIA